MIRHCAPVLKRTRAFYQAFDSCACHACSRCLPFIVKNAQSFFKKSLRPLRIGRQQFFTCYRHVNVPTPTL